MNNYNKQIIYLIISNNTKNAKVHKLLDRVKKLCKKGVIYQILSGWTYKYLKKQQKKYYKNIIIIFCEFNFEIFINS